jgi:hypothetical protein
MHISFIQHQDQIPELGAIEHSTSEEIMADSDGHNIKLSWTRRKFIVWVILCRKAFYKDTETIK